jgi:hypothetical protein
MAISEKDEWRERIEDGELIRIKAEDREAARTLAVRMDEILNGQNYLRALLAVQILSTSVVEGMAGKEWARALDDIFKQIPVG